MSSMNQPEGGQRQATTTRVTADTQSSTDLAQKILAKLQASAAPTIGITNTFNNCYASSVFQAMAHVPPIVDALRHAPTSLGATSRAILELVYDLHFSSEPVSLHFVFAQWERFTPNGTRPGAFQDPADFFLKTSSNLEESLGPAWTDLLTCSTEQPYTCGACARSGTTSRSSTMPLECPPRRHFTSVEDAFAAWAECLVVTCPACGTNVYPSSPPKLLNNPPILMLNLQGAHLSCNMATAVVDVPSTAPNDSQRFQLKAVVQHQPSHYVAYGASQNGAYCYDDSRVQPHGAVDGAATLVFLTSSNTSQVQSASRTRSTPSPGPSRLFQQAVKSISSQSSASRSGSSHNGTPPIKTKNALKKKRLFDLNKPLHAEQQGMRNLMHVDTLAPSIDGALGVLHQVSAYTAPNEQEQPAVLSWLLDVANTSLAQRGLEQLDSTSLPLDLCQKPEVLRLLLRMVQQRLQFDPSDRELSRALSRVPPAAEHNDSKIFRVYLRFLRFSDRDALDQHVKEYAEAHPADVTLPALLGHVLDSTPEAVPLTVPYVGISAAVSAQERGKQDEAGHMPSRRQNFTGALEPEIFELVDLRVPITSTTEFRHNQNLGNLEVFIIALLGGISLNSAPGGFCPHIVPSPEDQILSDNIRSTLSPCPPVSRSAEVQLAVSNHYRDQLKTWETLESKNLSSLAITTVLRNVETSGLGLLQLKDPTFESVNGDAPYWHKTSGPASAFSRRMWNQAQGHAPETFASTSQEVRQLYFPLFNFFDLDPGETQSFGMHVAYTSRLYSCLKPAVAWVEGSVPWQACLTGQLAEWPRHLSPEASHQFMSAHDSSVLLQAIETGKSQDYPFLLWKSKSCTNFVESVGLPFLTEVFPGQWCLQVPCLHAGAYKYRPSLLQPESRLVFLARHTFLVARDTVLALNPDVNSHDSMLHFLQAVQSRIAVFGLEAQIQEAQNVFRRASVAEGGLRRAAATTPEVANWLQDSGGASDLTRARDKFYHETVKMEGVPGSLQRIEQVRQLLDDNRRLARLNKVTHSSLKIKIGEHLPTSKEWAFRLVTEPACGSSLVYFASGTQSRGRDDYRDPQTVQADEQHRIDLLRKAALKRISGQGGLIPTDQILTKLMGVKKPSQPAFLLKCSRTPPCAAGAFLARNNGYAYHVCHYGQLDDVLGDLADCDDALELAQSTGSASPSYQRLPRIKAPYQQYIRSSNANSFETLPLSQDAALRAFFDDLVPGKVERPPKPAYKRDRAKQAEKMGGIPNKQLIRLDISRGKRAGAYHAMQLLTHPLTGQRLQDHLLDRPAPIPLVFLRVSLCLSGRTSVSDEDLGHILLRADEVDRACSDEKFRDMLRSFCRTYAYECRDGALANRKATSATYVPLREPPPTFATRIDSIP